VGLPRLAFGAEKVEFAELQFFEARFDLRRSPAITQIQLPGWITVWTIKVRPFLRTNF
jgi:hypothetical protein